MVCSYRYSDFVVHEINRQGKIVHLDDLSIPADIVEVRNHIIDYYRGVFLLLSESINMFCLFVSNFLMFLLVTVDMD